MKPKPWRIAWALFAGGVWLVGYPEPASAQRGWSGVVSTLAAPGYGPDVVVDPAGVVTAVWVGGTVRAARREPDADEWGPAVDVSPIGQGGGLSAGPKLVADRFGNVTAVWVWSSATGDAVVHAARFAAATQAWGATMSLSAITPADRIRLGRLATDASGNATVAWWRGEGDYPDTLWTVQAARYVATTGAWSDAVDLSARSHGIAGGLLAVSPNGDVTAIWNRADGLSPVTRQIVQATRFTVASGAWGPVRDLSTPTTPSSLSLLDPWAPVVDADGNVTAAWSRGDGSAANATWTVQAARYIASSGEWSPAASLAPGTEQAQYGRLAVDPAGTVTAIWTRVDETGANPREVVVASRYTRAGGVWTVPAALSQPARIATSISLVVGPTGDATAAWSAWDGAVWKVQGARHPPAGSAWSAAVDVAVLVQLPGPGPEAVGDDEGNIFVHWAAGEGLQAVRFTAATNALTGPDWLSRVTVADAFIFRHLVIDSAGRATAVWNRCLIPRCVGLSIESTRWLTTPGAPSVTSAVPGNGSLAIGFAAPATIDPAFAPTGYEYSVDDGLTWTPRSPPSAVSPLRISGLANGTTYNVRLRALNASGTGTASAAISGTPVLAPDPPTGLAVLAMSGQRVTVGWAPPAAGLPPAGYVLEGGLRPGEVLASLPTGASPALFTFDAPTGVFYLRIHAVAGGAWSAPSNEIRVFVGASAPPSAPANLLGLVNGSSVALSWTNTYAGGLPTMLGLSVTGAITTILPLPFGDMFTLSGVPPGTYTLGLIAANASGISPPSIPVTLVFPGACSGVPEAAINFQAWTAGSTIFVSWIPPASGPAVTSYTVQVTGAYVGSFTTTGRTLSGVARPGAYMLNVLATNACGASPATPTQTVVIP